MRQKYGGENRCGSCGGGLDSRGFCPNCDYNQVEKVKKVAQTGDIRRVVLPHNNKCACISCRAARTKAGARCQGCGFHIGYNRDYVRTDTGVMHLSCAEDVDGEGDAGKG